MESIFDEQIRFFASVTASVTHELNNVIAVTNEVVGLLGDFIEEGASNRAVPPEALKKVHNRLSAQVSRGQMIVKRLNRFAHTADEKMRTFDLVPVMENIVGLCERPAGLKKVKLDFRPGVASLMLNGNPFLLQLCFYQSLRLVLDSGCSGDILTISINSDDGSAGIAISGLDKGGIDAVGLGLAKLAGIMKELHGELRLIDDGRSLAIFVPSLD